MSAMLLFAVPRTGSLLGLLEWIAIAAVIVWAIIALIKWCGIPIPEPVRIIFIALAAILGVILLFRLFGLLT